LSLRGLGEVVIDFKATQIPIKNVRKWVCGD